MIMEFIWRLANFFPFLLYITFLKNVDYRIANFQHTLIVKLKVHKLPPTSDKNQNQLSLNAGKFASLRNCVTI